MARSKGSQSAVLADEDSGMWGAVVLQGVAAVIFGILAITWPGLTVATLVYLFGGFVLAWGMVQLVMGIGSIGKGGLRWVLMLLAGVLGIGVGVYVLRHPQVTLATLLLIMGISFIVQGIIDLVAMLFGDFNSFGGRVLMGIAGLLGIVVGGALLREPAATGLAFVWLLGLYAIVVGIFAFVRGLELKRIQDAK